MISEARREVAVTNGMPPLSGSCGLLDRFVGGTLRGDDYLQLLFHLDNCPRCFNRVRSFPEQKRQELYALENGLEEAVFEELAADQEADQDGEELTMLVHESRPRLAEVRTEQDLPSPPTDFSHAAKLLEQEMVVADEEIEKLKARLSALETRRAELKADLDHLEAATHILERFTGASTPKVVTPVPFARSKMNFSSVTQREAILQVLGQCPSQALNKKVLTQALIDGGFPFRSVERTERQNAVYQTCRRMVEGNELLMTIHGRDAFYQLVNGNGSRNERHIVAEAVS
ncbi:MAG: hypothetical protein ACE15E_23130 [Acidobacteriota bacterium]